MLRALAIFCLSLMVAPPAGAGPTTRPAGTQPSLVLWDVNGKSHRPLDTDDAKGVVLFFVATDCPISNGYAPEINRICTKYGDKSPAKFRFYFVQPETDLRAADAKKHASDFGYTCPVLLDPHRRLTAYLGAQVTPEVFVILPHGKIAYRGRIDDTYVAYGKARSQPTTHDLRDALDALLAGKPIATPRTKSIGCPIE